MSGGPDSRPDYYLTRNGTIGGILETDRKFRGQLLARNEQKLTNKKFEMVVHVGSIELPKSPEIPKSTKIPKSIALPKSTNLQIHGS